jgi:hypothetical protein
MRGAYVVEPYGICLHLDRPELGRLSTKLIAFDKPACQRAYSSGSNRPTTGFRRSVTSSASPVAIRMTVTALAITSAGRFWLRVPLVWTVS